MMIEEDTGVIDSSRILERFGSVPDDIEATWGGMSGDASLGVASMGETSG